VRWLRAGVEGRRVMTDETSGSRDGEAVHEGMLARPASGGQGLLFDEPSAGGDGITIGYRGPTAMSAAGITYRQLDYWARTGLVAPTVRSASGSGTQRLYSFKDILVLKVVKRLLDTGVSLQKIRVAVEALRARGVDDLADITLLSDGSTVYECTSSEEVVDLLRGGQGVFGIAVSGALRELRGSLAHLPGERADGLELAPSVEESADELARRRQRKTAAG
jgi:DNA-binding transcriptional MerR regulator